MCYPDKSENRNLSCVTRFAFFFVRRSILGCRPLTRRNNNNYYYNVFDRKILKDFEKRYYAVCHSGRINYIARIKKKKPKLTKLIKRVTN